jgi:hypothetical protein
MERRRFIRGTAAAAGAAWASPAVTSVAHAQTPGSPVDPPCVCSGQGTALRIIVAGILDLPLGQSSGSEVCVAGPIALPAPVSSVLAASVSVACGSFDVDTCTAAAHVSDLSLVFTDLAGGRLEISATTLAATATVDCDCVPLRTSTVVTLVRDCCECEVLPTPNGTIPVPPFGQIITNERTCEGGRYVARALHIMLTFAGLSFEIIAGEAAVTNDANCVCSPTDTR